MTGDRVFYWDFVGPRAEGTARHFREHLDGFLHREGVAGCATGLEQLAPAQWAVSCRTPAAAAEVVQRALRPRRHREVASPEREER